MTNALTLEPKTRFKDWHARKPLKELDNRGLKMVEAMTYGVDEHEAAEHGVQPYHPLSLEKAADVSGLKRRNARWIYSQPVFLSAYSKALSQVRTSHKARAVATMAAIMDDPGENSAADRAVRLKASQAIMGDESKGGVTVNANITNNTALQLSPGIVIRLKSEAPTSPLELASQNNGEPINLTASHHEDEEIDGVSLDPCATETMRRNWPSIGGGNE